MFTILYYFDKLTQANTQNRGLLNGLACFKKLFMLKVEFKFIFFMLASQINIYFSLKKIKVIFLQNKQQIIRPWWPSGLTRHAYSQLYGSGLGPGFKSTCDQYIDRSELEITCPYSNSRALGDLWWLMMFNRVMLQYLKIGASVQVIPLLTRQQKTTATSPSYQ